jgi:hypothetical protein
VFSETIHELASSRNRSQGVFVSIELAKKQETIVGDQYVAHEKMMFLLRSRIVPIVLEPSSDMSMMIDVTTLTVAGGLFGGSFVVVAVYI